MAVADGGLRQEPRGLRAGQYGRRCAAAGGTAATTAGFNGKRASGRKSQFGERCAGVRLRSRCFLGDACSLWLACRNHPFASDHVAAPVPWSANARYGSRLTRWSSGLAGPRRLEEASTVIGRARYNGDMWQSPGTVPPDATRVGGGSGGTRALQIFRFGEMIHPFRRRPRWLASHKTAKSCGATAGWVGLLGRRRTARRYMKEGYP